VHLVYAIDSLGSGGAQRQAVELAVHLKRGWNVRVVLAVYREMDFHGDRLRAAEIPVVRLPKAGQIDPRFPLRVRDWLREQRPGVVHAFLPMPSLWFSLGVCLARRDRPAFVAGERSAVEGFSWPHDLARRVAYPLADAVTANSRAAAGALAGRLGIDAARVHYLPNGLDLEAWDAEAEEEPPLELEPERFHLALVGGMRPVKNHAVVLEALERLGPERTRGWRIWFIGGEAGEPDYATRMRAQIERRGLAEIVRVVPPVRRMAALMRRLDGVLLPSLHEGFPNVVLEAMASRVPVVASAVGDVPDMLESGRTGFVLERNEATCLAAALAELAALPPDRRAELGRRARDVVEQRYAMPVVAARYLELYRAMVGRRGMAAGTG